MHLQSRCLWNGDIQEMMDANYGRNVEKMKGQEEINGLQHKSSRTVFGH